MKDTFRFTACLLFSGFAALSLAAQSTIKPDVKNKTFEKVWRTVNEKFFDPNFNGVNWKDVHDRYSPLVVSSKSDAEFYGLLNKMLGELKTSHMEIYTPESFQQFKQVGSTTGLGLREIDGQVVITRLLPDSSAVKAGLKTGFVIRMVSGQEVKTLDDAKKNLAGIAGTKLRVGYLNEKDELNEVELERIPLNDKGNLGGGMNIYYLFAAERLKGHIGYIRFSSFVDSVSPRIAAAIESMKDAPGLIIDLRGNGGGDDGVAIKMANLLFDRETQLMISKTRKGDSLYYKAKPAKDVYPGPVVILVDEFSGSASEQFAAGMQESGRAFVIGKTTEGGDMDADLEKLPSGAYLIYAAGQPRTPKGIVIEGRGVIPNKEVVLTRRELLDGKDAQLDAAIDYLVSKHRTN